MPDLSSVMEKMCSFLNERKPQRVCVRSWQSDSAHRKHHTEDQQCWRALCPLASLLPASIARVFLLATGSLLKDSMGAHTVPVPGPRVGAQRGLNDKLQATSVGSSSLLCSVTQTHAWRLVPHGARPCEKSTQFCSSSSFWNRVDRAEFPRWRTVTFRSLNTSHVHIHRCRSSCPPSMVTMGFIVLLCRWWCLHLLRFTLCVRLCFLVCVCASVCVFSFVSVLVLWWALCSCRFVFLCSLVQVGFQNAFRGQIHITPCANVSFLRVHTETCSLSFHVASFFRQTVLTNEKNSKTGI